jgi:hypothetical protein
LRPGIRFFSTAATLFMAGVAFAAPGDLQAPLASEAIGPAPEPGILGLVGMGLAMVAIVLRTKKGT